jgi:tetratricopeptide (TPR) repeat protein
VTAGDPRGAIGHYQEAVRIWSGLHRDPQDSDVASARAGLAAAMIKARRFDDAFSELHQVEQAFPASQPPNRFWRAAQRSIALLLIKRGRIDEAAARIDLLVASIGNAPADPAIELVVGQLRSAQGRHAEALQHLRVAAAAYGARPNRSVHGVALSALGAAELAAGETAASLATLQTADKLFEESQTIVSPDHAELWMALALAQLAARSPEAAARNADRAEHYWMGFGSNQAAIAQAQSLRQSALAQQRSDAAAKARRE